MHISKDFIKINEEIRNYLFKGVDIRALFSILPQIIYNHFLRFFCTLKKLRLLPLFIRRKKIIRSDVLNGKFCLTNPQSLIQYYNQLRERSLFSVAKQSIILAIFLQCCFFCFFSYIKKRRNTLYSIIIWSLPRLLYRRFFSFNRMEQELILTRIFSTSSNSFPLSYLMKPQGAIP